MSSPNPFDSGMTYEEFINQPSAYNPEYVAPAVRYLDWWFSIPHNIGSATEDAIKTLMQFARENDTELKEQQKEKKDKE